ncbi:MAG: septum formation protein Maf [Bacteroidales bacterium]|jgi:septum formation protein|nr:septum formation protein Maf [Bacteroidales bacterium]MDN5350837.1 nucleoside triphosphate pyrophosphatase [Bacteroidales bacterium]
MKTLLKKLTSYHVLLASKSPRRRQLLKDIGVDFEVTSKDTNEYFPQELNPEEVASYLSKKKSDAFSEEELPDNYLLITADTIVVSGNTILNKADNYQEANEMLLQLSGRTHDVITGITLRSSEKTISFTDQSEVSFKVLSQEEIDWYIHNYQPYDKAGAYGIQEWIGYIGITSIQGSFYNVMGLPTHRLYEALKHF